MGHASGVLFAEKLSFLEDNKIPLLRLQSLESDGQNGNETVWNKLNEQGKNVVNVSICNLYACQYFPGKSLVKTSLNLSLVCIYGLSCLLSDVKTVRKFKFMACWSINF